METQFFNPLDLIQFKADNLVEFFVGSVIASSPKQGTVVVDRSFGSLRVAEPEAAYVEAVNSVYGAQAINILPAGSIVLCASLKDSNGAFFNYVVCSLNQSLGLGLNSSFQRTPFMPLEEELVSSEEGSDDALKKFLLGDATNKLLYAHSYGTTFDLLAGDYVISDKESGCGLYVSRLHSTLVGTCNSFVDVSTVEGRTLVFGRSISLDSMTGETAYGKSYMVRNTAISNYESLGSLRKDKPIYTVASGDDEEEGTDKLELQVDAIPFYRIQHMEGRPVDGTQDIIIGFADESVEQHDPASEPAIMAVTRTDLSGKHMEMSTKSLLSLKSPELYAVHQIGYGHTPTASRKPDDEEVFDDLREKYDIEDEEEQEEEKPDDEEATVNAALLKMVDGLLAGKYSQAFKKIMAEHGFGPATAADSVKKAISESDSSDDGAERTGAIKKQFYDLPKQIELKDPVTGELHKYYDSTSFISQEEDGSICICDGYGSEIRMCRGNIYISPALDLVMESGRDTSVMAGRHQSYNSQNTCTINSNKATYIRACEDLRIVGGTENKGVVSLENLNTNEVDNNLNKPSSGVLINSASDLAVTATKDLYIGSNKANKAESQTDLTAGKGNIILDTMGVIYAHGTDMQVNMETSLVLKVDSVLETISGDSVQVGAADITTDATVYIVNNTDISASVLQYKNNKLDTDDYVHGNYEGAQQMTEELAATLLNPPSKEGIASINKQLRDGREKQEVKLIIRGDTEIWNGDLQVSSTKPNKGKTVKTLLLSPVYGPPVNPEAGGDGPLLGYTYSIESEKLPDEEEEELDANWPEGGGKGGSIMCTGALDVRRSVKAHSVRTFGPIATESFMNCKNINVKELIYTPQYIVCDTLWSAKEVITASLYASFQSLQLASNPDPIEIHVSGYGWCGECGSIPVQCSGTLDPHAVTCISGDMAAHEWEDYGGMADMITEHGEGTLNSIVEERETDEGLTEKPNDTSLGDTKGIDSSASDVASPIMESNKGTFTDKYKLARRFGFPDTYKVQMEYMPGMVWQETATGGSWKLKPIERQTEGGETIKTEAYPGYDILSSVEVSSKDGTTIKKEPFEGNFKTNSIEE